MPSNLTKNMKKLIIVNAEGDAAGIELTTIGLSQVYIIIQTNPSLDIAYKA